MTARKQEPQKVAAWFVAWRCGCAQTTNGTSSPDTLPTRCPGHDQERIHRPERLDVVADLTDTHLCGQDLGHKPCPPSQETPS